MATKTISVDTEAYGRLKARKARGESFSETIKRLVPKPFDVEKWLGGTAADPVGEEFVEAVEKTISSRRRPENMKAFNDVSGHPRSGRSAKVKSKSAAARR